MVAVGVNCTAVGHIPGLLRELAGGTDKPLVVYPNSGELYDAEQQKRALQHLLKKASDEIEELAESDCAEPAKIEALEAAERFRRAASL